MGINYRINEYLQHYRVTITKRRAKSNTMKMSENGHELNY